MSERKRKGRLAPVEMTALGNARLDSVEMTGRAGRSNGVVMIRALVICVGLLTTGMLTASAYAVPQSQDQGTTGTAGDASATSKPKPKKVWTNEDMSGVTGTISVVGTPTPQHSGKPQGASPISSFQQPTATKLGPNKPGGAKSSDDAIDEKTLAQVRQQLQKLQAGIDLLDKQIGDLKGASRGDSKNLGGLNADTWSYSTASIPDQIKSLEAKRAALQKSMDNLVDAARASGIEPGQLR
jgi:hypothetical protein